ncbi:hypothetical protein DVH24_011523 [Malus domestica]|uniref:RING-type E3 ubiquitin transferase n=1 Tax=Malus domestica TaxID=3750 RepID=A0A498JTL3_MALDO|nr:hypothetical protein DVH24_011523 [Malus domestica]
MMIFSTVTAGQVLDFSASTVFFQILLEFKPLLLGLVFRSCSELFRFSGEVIPIKISIARKTDNIGDISPILSAFSSLLTSTTLSGSTSALTPALSWMILFNLFFNSGEKALASAFYLGTIIIRLLPHAYDLYRARTGTWFVELPNIYASHRIDFYSTALPGTSSSIIPSGGMLFADVVFLQQRFNGRCILPSGGGLSALPFPYSSCWKNNASFCLVLMDNSSA